MTLPLGPVGILQHSEPYVIRRVREVRPLCALEAGACQGQPLVLHLRFVGWHQQRPHAGLRARATSQG